MKDKQDEKLLDDAIRNKLASATEEVPDYLWNKISVKSKRRKGLLWFFGSVSGFLFQDILMAALMVFVSTASPSFTNYATVAADKKPNHVIRNSIDGKNENSSNTNLISESPDFKSSEVENNSLKKSTITDSNAKLSISNKKSVTHKEYSKRTSTNSNHTDNSVKKNKRRTANNSDERLLALADPLSVKNNKTMNVNAAENNYFSDRENIQSILLKELGLFDVRENQDEVNAKEVKSFEKRASLPISIRLAAGTVYNNSKIKSSKELKNTTADWFNKSSALLIADIRIANNWLIAAGIQQEQSGLSVSISDPVSLSNWDVDTITGYIVSPFNPPVPYIYYDSSIVNTVIQKMYSGNVDVKFTTVTLQLERSLHKNAFDFRVGAGIGLNVSAISKGELILQDAESNESIAMDNVFKNQVSLSLLGSFETGYYIGSIFEPFVRIQYNKSIGNLMNDNSVLDYQHETITGSAGIRIRIKN